MVLKEEPGDPNGGNSLEQKIILAYLEMLGLRSWQDIYEEVASGRRKGRRGIGDRTRPDRTARALGGRVSEAQGRREG